MFGNNKENTLKHLNDNKNEKNYSETSLQSFHIAPRHKKCQASYPLPATKFPSFAASRLSKTSKKISCSLAPLLALLQKTAEYNKKTPRIVNSIMAVAAKVTYRQSTTDNVK